VHCGDLVRDIVCTAPHRDRSPWGSWNPWPCGEVGYVSIPLKDGVGDCSVNSGESCNTLAAMCPSQYDTARAHFCGPVALESDCSATAVNRGEWINTH
jgi:hypothetical protein